MGILHSRALLALIADIEALDHAGELLELHKPDVAVLHGEQLAVTVGSGYVAMFTPIAKAIGHTGDGHVVWTEVRRLQLKHIRKRE